MISVVSLLVLNKLTPVLAQAYITSSIYGIYLFLYKLDPEGNNNATRGALFVCLVLNKPSPEEGDSFVFFLVF